MKGEDQSHYEALLRQERQRLVQELGDLGEGLNRTARDSSGDLSAYSLHMADQATDAIEREKSFYIASLEGQALDDVDAALARLQTGTYGHCVNCGGEISHERLEVLPAAKYCIACQEVRERESRNGGVEA